MLNKFYIDGHDAYRKFGIFITRGCYDGLVEYPPLKSVESNDWHEIDGIEPDLSSVAVDTKQFSICFASHNQMETGKFFELISDGAIHEFEFREIGRTYKLRLVNQQTLALAKKLELFTLQFAFDEPLAGYRYSDPKSGIYPLTGYELDGRDLHEYGISVLKGSMAEVLKSPAVKKNLLINLNRSHGAVYDGHQVTFDSKEVTLNCVMRATTLTEFWHNYDALLHDLVRIEQRSLTAERLLYVYETGYEYPCYYKSCSNGKFHTSKNNTWFEFSLTFVFTSFRLYGDDFLLATEDDILVVTEDNENYIDLSYEN